MSNFITDNIDIWTSAVVTKKSVGRGSSKKQEAYGIKKLRELILELAVRGKLVPQDPDDEPASVLLGKILEEQEKLVKEKKIKKPKKFLEIKEDDKPFTLSKNWIWERIGNIGHDWGQKNPDQIFTYIDVSAIDNVKGKIKSPNVLNESDAPSRARKIVKLGTVIYSTVRPYLQNICVIDKEYEPEPIASTAFAILHPFQKMSGKFFETYLKSPTFVNYVESVQTGIAYPAINDKQFLSAIIPLPPINEQYRIATKVDELMTLCDKLEEEQEENSATHQILVETLLNALTNVETAEEFSQSWQRIAEHFDVLFTTEKSIDKLQETILQLAVMGKLVPQDADDEPASVLLGKIAEEKERLVKEGKIKKQKPLPEIENNEKLFILPKGWEWARLNNVIDVRDGTHDSPKNSDDKDSFPLVTSKDFKNGQINFDSARRISSKDHYEISKRSLVEVDDILFSMIGGNLGNQVIVTDKRPFSIKNVALFKYYDKNLTSPYFIKKYFENLAYTLQSFASGGAQPFISLGALRKLVIAVPPVEEQYRIATKVDELMALCDNLRLTVKELQTTQINLADTVAKQLAK